MHHRTHCSREVLPRRNAKVGRAKFMIYKLLTPDSSVRSRIGQRRWMVVSRRTSSLCGFGVTWTDDEQRRAWSRLLGTRARATASSSEMPKRDARGSLWPRRSRARPKILNTPVCCPNIPTMCALSQHWRERQPL